MKNTLLKLLSLILCLGTLLSAASILSACKDKSEKNNVEFTVIAENGESQYTIIRPEKAKADELRKSMHNASCVCVPPNVAEAILREFYGLPAAGGKTEATHGTPAQVADPGLISLEDFL